MTACPAWGWPQGVYVLDVLPSKRWVHCAVFAVYQLPQKTKVLRISGKLNCLTGCEETAPTGTRQATDRGQHAQHIKKKL